MEKSNAIGVFDSGLGGISVLNHLLDILPHEDFIYVGDSSWCPYGIKSYEEIQRRVDKIVTYLLDRGVKLIVVACNTATAAAIDYLRANYDIPFVGMEPAIKPAAKLTKTNVVGVLATPNTFNGHLFQETKQKYASHINVLIQKGCGLVELVENNQARSAEAYRLLSQYTAPMVAQEADYLVLGCTHYPFLTQTINDVAPSLKVIDPALPVAKRTLQLLKNAGAENHKRHRTVELLTTGELSKLKSFAKTFVQTDADCGTIAFY